MTCPCRVRPLGGARLLVLLLPLLNPHPIEAQTGSTSSPAVLGTLRDITTGDPVRGASVELLGAVADDVRARTISDVRGTFRLAAPAAGRYRVRAWRLALDTLVHGPFDLADGQVLEVSLDATAHAIEMEPLDVAVEGRIRLLQDAGFYERAMVGAGVYVTPQQIQARTFLQTQELLRTVPGIVFIDSSSFPTSADRCPRGWALRESRCERTDGTSGEQVMLTRSGLSTSDGVPCLPAVYLDGSQVQRSGPIGAVQQFDLATIAASQVLALEAFRGASEVPAQYSGASSACGVIMIWTVARLPVPRRL